jgi:hypothetical protein
MFNAELAESSKKTKFKKIKQKIIAFTLCVLGALALEIKAKR